MSLALPSCTQYLMEHTESTLQFEEIAKEKTLGGKGAVGVNEAP